MELVERHGAEYGVNQALAAMGLSKGTWYYRRTQKVDYGRKYAAVGDLLFKIAREHPAYGYRKVVKELREEHKKVVNHKVVRRLQKDLGLMVLRTIKPPRPSAARKVLVQMGDRINLVAGLETIVPFEVLYTDFTELVYDRETRKAQLMPMVDHTGKLVVGWALGPAANTRLALEAWDRASATLQRFGVKLDTVIVHHDQDPVYTSGDWIRQLRMEDGVRISYSLHGAKGTTEMESFNSHFKAETSSRLWDQKNLIGVARVVQSQMGYYNDIRRHASLGNIPPVRYLKENGLEPRRGVSPK